jgi:transposase InsO family protein
MGSFWGSLKNELVHHRRFPTREQAKNEITEYIEIFCNRVRKQARLGYLSAIRCKTDGRLARWTPRLTTNLIPRLKTEVHLIEF